VQVGAKGMGDALVTQIAAQLLAHELIKIRFNTESAIEPGAATQEIVSRTRSELVQHSGRTLVLYRRHDQRPKIELPRRRAPAK